MLNYKLTIKLTIKWILYLFGNIRSRFLLLTPGFLSNQLIFDKKNNRLLKFRIRNEKDYYVIKQIFVDNDYGFEKLIRKNEILDYYNSIIIKNKVPLIIDLGSNNGASALFFSTSYSQSIVVGVEPDESNLNLSKENNHYNKNKFYCAAIGNKVGKGLLRDPGRGTWGYQIVENKNGTIDIITVESLLKKYSSITYTPFIIKIDIEGFEGDLFKKNTDWIDLFPIIIIELHDWMLPKKTTSSNFLKQISKKNRDFIYHGENVFSISNTLL